MTNKKKYSILFLVIIILLILTLAVIGREEKTLIAGDTLERSSKDYQITEDIVILNVAEKKDSLPPELIQENNFKINKLTLFSPDFQNLEIIPSRFTCDGDNINPNLEISGVDKNAKSLVLIMSDPDAPGGIWDHWIKFNIPATISRVIAGEGLIGIAGKGTGGNLNYSGPCPPKGKHQYVFKLYALDTELILPEGSSKIDVENAMKEHILQTSELIGTYERKIDLIEPETTSEEGAEE